MLRKANYIHFPSAHQCSSARTKHELHMSFHHQYAQPTLIMHYFVASACCHCRRDAHLTWCTEQLLLLRRHGCVMAQLCGFAIFFLGRLVACFMCSPTHFSFTEHQPTRDTRRHTKQTHRACKTRRIFLHFYLRHSMLMLANIYGAHVVAIDV